MKRVGHIGLIISILLFVSCKQEVYFNISTKVQPEDGGSIVVTPSSGAVLEGTAVTFKANPNNEYVFTGWSGGLSGTENPKTIVASSDFNVVANFTLRTYPLSLSVEGDGAINERVLSTKTDYSTGTVVELTANPAEHWLFDHWEGDLTGNTNPTQITVSSAKTVKAVFVKKMYDLTISVEGEGSVSEKVVETKSSYQEGTIVELTANPADHWVFDHWEGDLTGSNNPARTTVSSSKKVKAVFVEKMYLLTVEIEGNGAVNEKVITTKAGLYQEGTIVELTATPGDHWVFDHWEGNLEGNQNPVQITIMSAQSVKAVFVEKMYPLTVEVQGGGAVKEEVIGTKSGTYQEGSLVQLTATPNTYWAFDHWEGDVTGTDNPAFITISGTACVKAIFVENDPGIVFTETDYVSPQQMFDRLGFGIKITAQLEADIKPDGVVYESDPKITQQYFDVVKEEGVKTVCIPVTWLGRVGPAPDYLIDETWMDRVAEVVGYAEKAGLNASIDLSYDSVDDLDDIEWQRYSDDIVWLSTDRAYFEPSYRKAANEKFKAVWTQIARRFRDKGDFLMFHCFTEPGSGVLWDYDIDMNNPQVAGEIDVLNERYQIFVDAIRSTGGNNATRWLVLSPATDIPTHIQFIKRPVDYVSNNRMIYSFHFFDPAAFTKDGVCDEWGRTASFVNDYLKIDELFIADLFRSLRDDFIVNQGTPVVCTEFGCTNRATERAKAFQMYWFEYVIRAGHENGIPMYILDCGVDESYGDDGYYEGFYIHGHATGKYLTYGKEIMDISLNAMYSEDPEYTLKSIYDRAPFLEDLDTTLLNIPDPVFLQYMIEHHDFNRDGFIDSREVLGIEWVDVSTDNIHSLEGIERCANLKHLVADGSAPGKGKLVSLDLSNNKQLNDISILNNAVRDFTISGCSNLKSLLCWGNDLSRLDLTGCPGLELLACAQNRITSLDLSPCKGMKELAINDNLLESIDVSSLSNLEILECGGNPIKDLDVSYCPALKQLITTNSPFLERIIVAEGQSIDSLVKDTHTSMDSSGGIYIGDAEFEKYLLEHFDLNKDGKISLSEAAEIREVEISPMNIKSVQALKHAGSLTSFVAIGDAPKQGKLTRLDMSHNPLLTNLAFWDNNVEVLDISNCTRLTYLNCWRNNLSELDVSNCPDLEILCCAQNNLTSLDISKCPKLRVFCPNENDLEELDLSNNPLLEEVEIHNNPRLRVVWLKKGQTIIHFIKDSFTEIRYKD